MIVQYADCDRTYNDYLGITPIILTFNATGCADIHAGHIDGPSGEPSGTVQPWAWYMWEKVAENVTKNCNNRQQVHE